MSSGSKIVVKNIQNYAKQQYKCTHVRTSPQTSRNCTQTLFSHVRDHPHSSRPTMSTTPAESGSTKVEEAAGVGKEDRREWDEKLIRRAIELAWSAREHGNHPFGGRFKHACCYCCLAAAAASTKHTTASVLCSLKLINWCDDAVGSWLDGWGGDAHRGTLSVCVQHC